MGNLRLRTYVEHIFQFFWNRTTLINMPFIQLINESEFYKALLNDFHDGKLPFNRENWQQHKFCLKLNWTLYSNIWLSAARIPFRAKCAVRFLSFFYRCSNIFKTLCGVRWFTEDHIRYTWTICINFNQMLNVAQTKWCFRVIFRYYIKSMAADFVEANCIWDSSWALESRAISEPIWGVEEATSIASIASISTSFTDRLICWHLNRYNLK